MKITSECPESVPRWKFQRDAARRGSRRSAPVVAATGGPGPRHIELVRGLAEQGAGTRRFPTAMRRIGVTTAIRPDAWFTREERKHIDVYEVVVCNGIDQNRRAEFRRFHKVLTAAGWTWTLYRMDRHGEVSVFDPFALPACPDKRCQKEAGHEGMHLRRIKGTDWDEWGNMHSPEAP